MTRGHGYIDLLFAVALFLAILLMLRALGWIH